MHMPRHAVAVVALIALMVYTFARVGAAVSMRVGQNTRARSGASQSKTLTRDSTRLPEGMR